MWTWLDESIEHSDSDIARATVLARRISQLDSEEEQWRFRYDYDPYEDCECEYCISQRAEDDRQLQLVRAERELDREMLCDKLEALGARMMRP